jgi:hypothetical protein
MQFSQSATVVSDGPRGISVEDLPIILLVEDEELIRNIVEKTLDDGGCKVIAQSGMKRSNFSTIPKLNTAHL